LRDDGIAIFRWLLVTSLLRSINVFYTAVGVCSDYP